MIWWRQGGLPGPPSGKPVQGPDGIPLQHEAPLGTENGEQHFTALARSHVGEDRELSLERAANDAHAVTAQECRSRFQGDHAIALASLEIGDDGLGHAGRAFAVAQHVDHADGRTDRIPAINDLDEDIPWKQDRLIEHEATAHVTLDPDARQVNLEMLLLQPSLGDAFALAFGLRDGPKHGADLADFTQWLSTAMTGFGSVTRRGEIGRLQRATGPVDEAITEFWRAAQLVEHARSKGGAVIEGEGRAGELNFLQR